MRGSLFEKGFLPLVKECRRDAMPVAEVADRCALDEVFAQDIHFLLRGVVDLTPQVGHFKTEVPLFVSLFGLFAAMVR